MRITDALRILQEAPPGAAPYTGVLACGFTPLHVQTFLAARLQQALPDRRVTITPGLFGSLAGTVEGVRELQADAVAIVLEWSDLDPRLGFRSAGAWGPAAVADMVAEARKMADRIAEAVGAVPAGIPVGVCLPTLPLPPVFHAPGGQAAAAELSLQGVVFDFAARVSRRRGCAVVNGGRLDETSPPGMRLDLKSDLLAGLPYTLPHAAAIGEGLARVLAPKPPKKGIITDLDDTLWRGLVGEIGPSQVSWDLGSHSQIHGLYQKLLASLAEEGVLVGVASKNDSAVVEAVFQRGDLLLPSERVFPRVVHWEAKSGSVSSILRAWNIAADSVVFVDDSSMELAEVAAAHPGIECLRFPKDDYAAGFNMLRRLRDLFGKAQLSREDSIRLESIRRGAQFQELESGGSAADAFLAQAEALITFDWNLSGDDPRTLELVNKTNQFNLNGIRCAHAEWNRRLSRPGALLAAVSYQDKFGPLGKIAVIQGIQEGERLHIETWVMSCRAFSRRIEHQCLKSLFECSGAAEIFFDFQPTARNGPLQDFLEGIAEAKPAGPFSVTRSQFEGKCPRLYHRIAESQVSLNPWTKSQPA